MREAMVDIDSKWGKKKQQILDLLTVRDMSVSELCEAVGASPNQVYSMISHIPDSALIYETTGHNGKIVYGRLKKCGDCLIATKT